MSLFDCELRSINFINQINVFRRETHFLFGLAGAGVRNWIEIEGLLLDEESSILFSAIK